VGIIETSAALGACLLVLTIAVVLDRRPYRPGKRNYIPVMIIALAASLGLGRIFCLWLYVITYSVFRLAARCTDLCGWIPRMECAPVSEKRVGLNRSPGRQGYGR
jgi:hypothetical protein